MRMDAGRMIALSLPRRFVCDLLHFAKKIPTVPVQREMNLGKLRLARQNMKEPVSWAAIFTKAYARVALDFPELRRAYISFPWDHLYEFPYSIASVAIERDYQGEKGVFFVHLRAPDTQNLHDLDGHLRRAREEPIENFSLFRRALKLSRWPRPLRRLVWWLGLNLSGRIRAKRMGTFGVSVYSSLGAESLHPISPLTTTLNYGVIRPDGSVTVRIIYDHRVMDGSTVARALTHMEKILVTEILNELESQTHQQAA